MKVVDPQDTSALIPPSASPGETNAVQPGPVLISMSDVEAREVDWLWPDRIAAGRITLLVGAPGVGKSFITLDLAARVSAGRNWPDGSACGKGSVILISAEDDPADTIRPRLDAHGADVSKVRLLNTVKRVSPQDGTCEVLFSLQDVDALSQAFEQTPDCRLVIVDPVGSFLACSVDTNKDNQVRSVLAPVANLAQRHGVAVLLILHRRKGNGGGMSADETAMGSRAFTGIARNVWHVCADVEDDKRRLFLPGKSNLAAQQLGLAFSIAGEPAQVEWEPDPMDMTADEALAREGRASNVRPIDKAVDFLRAQLAGGPVLVNDVLAAATLAGIAERTLMRAKKKVGVESKPNGYGGPRFWSLIQNGQQTVMHSLPSVCQEQESGTL